MGMEGYRSFQRNFTWKTVHGRYREVLASLNHAEAGSWTIQSTREDEFKAERLEEVPCQVSP
jgi:hypothetical protein